MPELKFLIDVCVGFAVESEIRKLLDFDFKCVRDKNPKMIDVDIVHWANNEERIIITSDKDFGELIFKNKMAHHGVLLLRIDEITTEEKINIISGILKSHKEKLQNHFCVYQNKLLRVR